MKYDKRNSSPQIRHTTYFKNLINTKDQQLEKLTAEVAELRLENIELKAALETQKGIVSALLTRIYGAKSEKMSHDQLLLAFLESEAKKPEAADGNEEPPAAEKTTKLKRAKRTNKLIHSLESLPTNECTITDAEVLANPDAFRLLSEEISIRLHTTPSTFTREIIKRQTHVRKDDPDAIPVTPPLEPCLLPGSVLTPSLGALLLTEKFCCHQPFYRQEWRFRATHAIELKRNNMCNWHDHLADRLLPLCQLIATQLRQSSYLKADEAPISCLEPGKGKAATGYFRVYHHPEHGPLFDWHKSRANTCLDNILIDDHGNTSFSGYLQSDGLRAYRTFRERYPDLDIIAVSSPAHIRRKFWEARSDHPRITAWILLQIGKIYDIERELKEQHAAPLERQKTTAGGLRRHVDHF